MGNVLATFSWGTKLDTFRTLSNVKSGTLSICHVMYVAKFCNKSTTRIFPDIKGTT